MKTGRVSVCGLLIMLVGCLGNAGFGQTGLSGEFGSPAADALADAIENSEWEKILSIAESGGNKTTEQMTDFELYGIGLAHLNLSNSSAARPYLDEHLKRNPESTVTIECLAEVAFRQRDTKSLEKYLALRPGNVKVLIAAANRYESMANDELDRELPETHVDYSTLRNAKPGRSRAREFFGIAEDFLRQAIATDPESYEVRIEFAEFHVKRENFESAIGQFLQANRINPLSQDHYFLLASLYRRVGDLDHAMESINMAIKAKPSLYPELMMLRADIYSRLGQYDKAVEDLRLVFEKNHNHRTVRGKLGDAAYGDQNYPLALFAFRESYRTDNQVGALAKIGRCVFELGQDEMAIAYVDQAIEKSMANDKEFSIPSDWHFTRGRALWNLGKKKEAATDLLAACQKNPASESKAEWALHVFKDIQDPHGLVDIAYVWGAHHSRTEAFEIFSYVQSNWRFPVMVNHKGERTVGHNRKMLYSTAQLYDEAGLASSAYDAWARAYYDWSLWSCWLAVNADQLAAAARGFRVLVKSETPETAQRAASGLAFVELHARDLDEVRKNLGLITLDYLKSSTASTAAYAEVMEDPGKISELSIFDLTGIFGYYFETHNGQKGLSVKGLLPGSLLNHIVPAIQPKDVILQVDGLELDDFDRIDELRNRKPADQKIKILALRGDFLFEVGIESRQATESILKALTPSTEKK